MALPFFFSSRKGEAMPWEFVGVKMPQELREDLEGLATRDASTLSAVVRRLIEAEAQRNLPRERSHHDD
jgi:hypothetical protein